MTCCLSIVSKRRFHFLCSLELLSFLAILEMFVAFSRTLKRSCILWPSCNSLAILPLLQSHDRLVGASRCSFDFKHLLGF